MEITQQNNNRLYIINSISNIDNYIDNNEYKKAFCLLIMVLERLDEIEKVQFIDYYSKKNNLFKGEPILSYIHSKL